MPTFQENSDIYIHRSVLFFLSHTYFFFITHLHVDDRDKNMAFYHHSGDNRILANEQSSADSLSGKGVQ